MAVLDGSRVVSTCNIRPPCTELSNKAYDSEFSIRTLLTENVAIAGTCACFTRHGNFTTLPRKAVVLRGAWRTMEAAEQKNRKTRDERKET